MHARIAYQAHVQEADAFATGDEVGRLFAAALKTRGQAAGGRAVAQNDPRVGSVWRSGTTRTARRSNGGHRRAVVPVAQDGGRHAHISQVFLELDVRESHEADAG